MKNNLFFLLICQLILAGILFIFWPELVLAGPTEYQRCKTGSVCVIGEFLYDDEYNPIATASCTLTSRYPDGSLFLNSVAMTAVTDGWYYYSVETSNKPEGLYRSQMCCTAASDYLCLDKSFFIGPSFMTASEAAAAVWNAQTSSYSAEGTFGKNLQNPVLTAADIWNYTNRTLSSFGTLVADIWNYTSRTLTNFGTLLADIWGFGNRTLTSENLDNGKKLVTEEKVKEATEAATASIKGSSGKDLTQLSGEIAVLATKIDNLQVSINQILSKWGSYSASDIYDKVKNLSSEIAAINTIPNTNTLISLININIEKTNEIINRLVAMEAILSVNRSLLEGLTTEPVIKTWIEEASIVFKTLVYNPSTNEKKTVKIKYYLPAEFKKENLIKIDKELSLSFDPKENTYYFQGEIELAPKETRVFAVEVEDLWQISKEEIESLRRQANQLFDPLKKTAFYAQGAVLKSDIDVGLDRVWLTISNVYTPEARIKAYREAKIELAAVRQKIDNLKNLLAQAASSRSLFGFIGGISATVSWGLVLVFLIGFSILFYYFQKIKKEEKPEAEVSQKQSVVHPHKTHLPFHFGPLIFFVLFLTGLMVGVLIAYNSQNQMIVAKKTIEKLRLTPYSQRSTVNPLPTPVITLKTETNATNEAVLGSTTSAQMIDKRSVMIIVPSGSYLNLRQTPSLKGEIVSRIKNSLKAELLTKTEGWKKVRFYSLDEKKEIEGWVAEEFVVEP